MGLMSDVARGILDPVHADVENISDPRTWRFLRKCKDTSNPDEGQKEQNQVTDDVQKNPDSIEGA